MSGNTLPPSDMNTIYYSAGRLPWYDAETSLPSRPFLIGVAGGTASGKSTVCEMVLKKLGLSWVQIISTDNFYKPLTPQQMADVSNYNFDHPTAFDWDLMHKSLQKMCRGERCEIPLYDFVTHSRKSESRIVYGADVLIVEGILCFWDSRIREMCDLLVFVDTDSDVRLARRLRRDIAERGRSLNSVLDQYERTVKPSFDDFVAPTKKHADIIIPRGGDNYVAIDLLTEHIRSVLSARGVQFSETNSHVIKFNEGTGLPDSFRILKQSKSLRARHTIIRNQDTKLEDLRLQVDALSNILFENALDVLQYSPKNVTTPTGSVFGGVERSSKICAVSVVRSGEAMESGVRMAIEGIALGKIVIQQPAENQHHVQPPRFYYSKLPKDLSEHTVFLLDAVLSTSATVQMAIRLLLDHGVKESNIVLLTLIAAPEGLVKLCRMFPKLHAVISCMDEGLDEHFFSSPGCGPFGNRFFGTE